MFGVLGLSAKPLGAAEGVSAVTPLQPDSYCHMKIPAIDEKTLGTFQPQLQDQTSPNAGEIIDYSGPCDHDPLGPEEIQKQLQDHQLRETREFSSE
jgi:hypothetical protein